MTNQVELANGFGWRVKNSDGKDYLSIKWQGAYNARFLPDNSNEYVTALAALKFAADSLALGDMTTDDYMTISNFVDTLK
jgi:hypothetical protein